MESDNEDIAYLEADNTKSNRISFKSGKSSPRGTASKSGKFSQAAFNNFGLKHNDEVIERDFNISAYSSDKETRVSSAETSSTLFSLSIGHKTSHSNEFEKRSFDRQNITMSNSSSSPPTVTTIPTTISAGDKTLDRPAHWGSQKTNTVKSRKPAGNSNKRSISVAMECFPSNITPNIVASGSTAHLSTSSYPTLSCGTQVNGPPDANSLLSNGFKFSWLSQPVSSGGAFVSTFAPPRPQTSELSVEINAFEKGNVPDNANLETENTATVTENITEYVGSMHPRASYGFEDRGGDAVNNSIHRQATVKANGILAKYLNISKKIQRDEGRSMFIQDQHASSVEEMNDFTRKCNMFYDIIVLENAVISSNFIKVRARCEQKFDCKTELSDSLNDVVIVWFKASTNRDKSFVIGARFRIYDPLLISTCDADCSSSIISTFIVQSL